MTWHNLSTGLITGLIANFIFAILVATTAIALGNYYWRRRVRDFFDILPRKGRLPIFLSNIVVKRSGTIGTAPIAQGFYGTAISEVEYFYALQFAATVETRPAYRALRALDPDDILTPVDPIVCEVNISPTADEIGASDSIDTLRVIRQTIGNRTAIIVGAPIYNTFTLHLMDKLSSKFSFIRDEVNGNPVRGIKVRQYKGQDDHRDYIRRPDDDGGQRQLEYFILEKLTWPIRADAGGGRKSTKIFICAGTCSAATAAAVRALSKNWKDLKQRTTSANFGILCELYLQNIELREAHPPDDDLQVVFSYGISSGLL